MGNSGSARKASIKREGWIVTTPEALIDIQQFAGGLKLNCKIEGDYVYLGETNIGSPVKDLDGFQAKLDGDSVYVWSEDEVYVWNEVDGWMQSLQLD